MKIVYFSPIDWDFLKQRPQHIAEELSKDHTVYFIEPSISIVKSIIYKKNFHKSREFNVNANLKVIRPSGKFRLPKIFDLVDFAGINLAYEKKILMKLIEESDLIWVGSPIYYGLVRDIRNKNIVYDKMDDYGQLTKSILLRKLIETNEKGLLSKASLIFTSSKFLFDKINGIGKPVVLVRNGLDESICLNKDLGSNKVSDELKRIKENGSVIFGYIGTIDHWFDYDAIQHILEHRKNNKVIIVGHNKLPIYNHENVYYFDAVPKNELGSIINEFDYCLYTFKKNALLDSIDPVKIYEYLGFNKKVIAVKSAETIRFKKQIKLYSNDIGLEKVLNELDCIKAPFNSDELKKFINDNVWYERVLSMIEHMNAHKILK
ncbi:hypothetical protein [Ferviditalea candida]|uniref:Glycosyltransferase n=1 Tax=Ferviditalea candida TaxID=3108399 RepID=A0ABU5ZEK0_9BACL|nr:hypothetical protein [Paenibacillaceae bacterium T2]